MTQKIAVVEAINFLIQSPTYTHRIREITDIIERWSTHPSAYEGELQFLNSLIDVGLENRDAFERLVSLIDSKRKLVPEIKRIDYQRDLMRQRRARMAMAMEVHVLSGNTLASAEDKKLFAATTQARWSEARDAFIQARGSLSWKERNAAAQEFWDKVDRQLDNIIKAYRRKR